MAQIKPEWQIVKEAEDIVARLAELYPEKFGHIDPSIIGCAMITNKDRPDSADWDFKIKGVKEPESLYSTKQYVIWFHQNIWDAFSRKQRVLTMIKALKSIPEEPDGSLLKEDLKDWRDLVSRYGVDYMNDPNIPDFTESKQVL